MMKILLVFFALALTVALYANYVFYKSCKDAGKADYQCMALMNSKNSGYVQLDTNFNESVE
jgi:hypothetical protein